jgi:hypothetical protein
MGLGCFLLSVRLEDLFSFFAFERSEFVCLRTRVKAASTSSPREASLSPHLIAPKTSGFVKTHASRAGTSACGSRMIRPSVSWWQRKLLTPLANGPKAMRPLLSRRKCLYRFDSFRCNQIRFLCAATILSASWDICSVGTFYLPRSKTLTIRTLIDELHLDISHQ